MPITGPEPVVPPIMLAPTPANIQALGLRFPNPIPTTAESIERGRDRYDINCALCHGDQGAGDGPINAAMSGIIPSLLTDQARRYTDGYIFSIIVNGRGLMKQYRQSETPSGLKYADLAVGDGESPPNPDVAVLVHYTMYLLDGTEVQSSRTSDEPTSYLVSGNLKGIAEGIADMKVGGMRKLVIPSNLAFGSVGQPRQGSTSLAMW